MKRVAGHYAKVSEGRKQTLVPAEPWHSGKQEVRPSGVVVAHARPARRCITTGGSNFAALASQIYADAERGEEQGCPKLCDVCPANILYHHATAILSISSICGI